MTNPYSHDVARMVLALMVGVSATLVLLMLMSVLLTQRLWDKERVPALVIELKAWPVPVESTAPRRVTPLPSPVSQSPEVAESVVTESEAVPAPPKTAEAPAEVVPPASPHEPPVDESVRGHELVTRSLEWVKSQPWAPEDVAPSTAFRSWPVDPRTNGQDGSETDDGLYEVYRLPNGNLKVKMMSFLGKPQCFEVPPQDPFDEFSFGLWMLTRC